MIDFTPMGTISEFNLDAYLGVVPLFIHADDPRPIKDQINDRYVGGWTPQRGFSLDLGTMVLGYPGDPDLEPVAVARLRGEAIYAYPHAWFLVLEPDGSFEVSRLD